MFAVHFYKIDIPVSLVNETKNGTSADNIFSLRPNSDLMKLFKFNA